MIQALRRTSLAAALCLGSMAQAGDISVVVELFTSQGCSSCPPADRMMSELARRDGVLPLSLHVDYWDYMGWKDRFGSPRNTLRQRDYARANGERMIYTPQMVVDGETRVVGSRGLQVARAVEAHAEAANAVDIDTSRDGDRIEVAARLREEGAEPVRLVIQLVSFDDAQTVTIDGGENDGHTFTYTNVVHDWQVIGEWDGTGTWRGSGASSGPTAVLVQHQGPGAIIGAAVVD